MKKAATVRTVVPPPRPKGKLCTKLCQNCPFKADGSGYARGHADFPSILRSVELGGAFYCHQTVILDPRTILDEHDEPTPRIQPHFEQCRGAWEHYLARWRERVKQAGAEPGG